jgi:hypothetical protein
MFRNLFLKILTQVILNLNYIDILKGQKKKISVVCFQPFICLQVSKRRRSLIVAYKKNGHGTISFLETYCTKKRANNEI